MTVMIVLLIFCSVFAVPETPDYYSPDSVLLFADHLFRQQDYLRAAYEYERYGFLQTGNDPAAREILLRAGKAFQCAGEYDRSLDLFAVLLETAESNRIRELAIYETGLTYFRMARYQESLLFLQDQPLESLLPEAGLLVGADLMMLGQWRLAEETFDLYEVPTTEVLRNIAREGSTMRRKSPLAAALLSAVVPGSGKIYAGEYGDGIHSLIFIGLIGTLSVLSFRAEGMDSIRGWIYASVGGVLHIGNIYGSTVSARRYNRLREEALFQEVQKEIPACSEFFVGP
jgi:TM2 domain-containing membrane protein YozV